MVSQGQTAFTVLFAGLRLVASYSSSGSLSFLCDAKFGLFILVLLQFSSCPELFSVEMRNVEKQCCLCSCFFVLDNGRFQSGKRHHIESATTLNKPEKKRSTVHCTCDAFSRTLLTERPLSEVGHCT